MACRPRLGDDNVRATPFLDPLRIPLNADQTMFHGMVKPMASSANGDETLQMVDFYPSNLVADFVPPCLETSIPSVHGPRSTPKEEDTLILEILERKVNYGLVRDGTIRKLYGGTYRSIRNDKIEVVRCNEILTVIRISHGAINERC